MLSTFFFNPDVQTLHFCRQYKYLKVLNRLCNQRVVQKYLKYPTSSYLHTSNSLAFLELVASTDNETITKHANELFYQALKALDYSMLQGQTCYQKKWTTTVQPVLEKLPPSFFEYNPQTRIQECTTFFFFSLAISAWLEGYPNILIWLIQKQRNTSTYEYQTYLTQMMQREGISFNYQLEAKLCLELHRQWLNQELQWDSPEWKIKNNNHEPLFHNIYALYPIEYWKAMAVAGVPPCQRTPPNIQRLYAVVHLCHDPITLDQEDQTLLTINKTPAEWIQTNITPIELPL